jgi:dipeptidyl aminopeptidase/acylaminoacyl peptidase
MYTTPKEARSPMTGRRLNGRIPLRDDALQWELDRAISETGRVQHFFSSSRKLPASVKTHAMISKHLARPAQRLERLADAEAAAGHELMAAELYYDASARYAEAQHTIFENSAEKQKLHGASLRCYGRLRELASVRIEHLEIPWGDAVVSGYLHLAPVEGPAPLVFFVPGCDMTKEMAPHPLRNWATQRGMHLFVFDGPGQGEANLRDVPLTVDNYEDAASAALSVLLSRPDVDGDRVGLFAMSFGSYWGVRMAATDDRYKATVLQWASVCDKRLQFDGAVSPRYKQLFAYLTRAETEEELDRFIDQMTLDDHVGRITSDTLVTIGEFDPRSPLDQVLDFYDALEARAEMWIFGDQQHVLSLRGKGGPQAGAVDSHDLAMEWMRDRLLDREFRNAGEVIYLEPNGTTPNDPGAARKRHWYEGG